MASEVRQREDKVQTPTGADDPQIERLEGDRHEETADIYVEFVERHSDPNRDARHTVARS
jgi:hypothetical protein